MAGIEHGALEVFRPAMFTRNRSRCCSGMASIPDSHAASHGMSVPHNRSIWSSRFAIKLQAKVAHVFQATPGRLHWSTPDPAKVTGSEAEIGEAFDRAFFMLKSRVEEFMT